MSFARERAAIAIRHVDFEDLGLLEPLLGDRGYRVSYRDAPVDAVDDGEVDGADLLVVLGGPIGVADVDRYPFLGAELTVLRQRLAAARPTLGICLGAQLIAHALGAPVRATGRQEIGYRPLQLTAAAARSPLAPLADADVLHWHGDEFAIPTGATRLAQSDGFPNQAFELGPQILGLQFHLEARHDQLERWLVGHAHELASAGIDPDAIRRDGRRHGPRLERLAQQALGSWLDALPGPDDEQTAPDRAAAALAQRRR